MANITYRQVNDYMIPNLTLLPEETAIRLSKWGMLHKDYMLQNKKVAVTIMTAEGRFWRYLADIDKQAKETYALLVDQMKEKEGITEQLKAENQILWVHKMSNIEARAREFVLSDFIYR